MLRKSNIEALIKLPDERMLSMIRMMLSGFGVDIRSKILEKKNAERIRALLSEITDEDIVRIEMLADAYKRGGRVADE